MVARAKHIPTKQRAHSPMKTSQVQWDDPSGTQMLLSLCLWMVLGVLIYGWDPLPMLQTAIVAVTSRPGGSPMAFRGDLLQEDVVTTRCWSGSLPSTIRKRTDGLEAHERERALATVTLYAPCPSANYVNVAQRYAEAAHAWTFVQSSTANQLVVHHHGQPPRILRGDIRTGTMLEAELRRVMVPPVGLLLYPDVYFYQPAIGLGLVTLLPEPELGSHEFDHKYLPMLSKVQARFASVYDFTYILPEAMMYAGRVASEFGITTFPSIVVHKEFPGQFVIYRGDMSADSVELFLDDVALGCADHGTDYMAGFSKKRDRLVCEAWPILGSS